MVFSWRFLAGGLAIIMLTACETAKYRSWQDGDAYFKKTPASMATADKDKASKEVSDEEPKTKTLNKLTCQFPYKVQAGDTLSALAEECGLDMMVLIEANELYPPYHLTIGQVLVLSVNQPKISLSEKIASSQMQWPTAKNLKYEFSQDSQRRSALKVFGAIGDPIYAVDAGEVVYAGKGLKQFGYLLLIKHESGFLSVYAHNNRLLVKEKDMVNKGDMIATMGRTGRVNLPQLYLEMRYKGHKTDAKVLLQKGLERN